MIISETMNGSKSVPEDNADHVGSSKETIESVEQYPHLQIADGQLRAPAGVDPGAKPEEGSGPPENLLTPPDQTENHINSESRFPENPLKGNTVVVGRNIQPQKPTDKDLRRPSASSQNQDQAHGNWFQQTFLPPGKSKVSSKPARQEDGKDQNPVRLNASGKLPLNLTKYRIRISLKSFPLFQETKLAS